MEVLWGKVRLNPGVKTRHMKAYYFMMFAGICVFVFMSNQQPVVLDEILEIKRKDQGSLTGDLSFYSELTTLATVSVWGALSERVGRAWVAAIGFGLLAVSYSFYSFPTATWEIIVYRLIYATGAAAITAKMTSILSDYAYDDDKGKASGFMGIFSGFGAMACLFGLAYLPTIFKSTGLITDEVDAIHMMYFVVVGICAATGLICLFFLQGVSKSNAENKKSIPTIVGEAIYAGKQDPVLMMSYAAAFVSRGDSTVLNTFLSLWVTQYILDGKEGSSSSSSSDFESVLSEASAEAGLMVGISQGAALFTAPLWGILCDKIGSVAALNWSCLVAAAGYFMIAFLEDPTSGNPLALMGCVVIGIGQIGGIITAQALVAYHSPPDVRGSVGGVFGFTGAVGILVASKLGGELYDVWLEGAPFVVLAILNLLLMLWGIWLEIFYPRFEPPHITLAKSQLPKGMQNPAETSPLMSGDKSINA
eukprot:TRINITY_DN1509_c0_g1_i1.p1 TRINITY_DN1509_c0_g1~~TRINITY_DN1509_c0_g1_i1.p1  ORF type:complete len:505 (-),score=132.17 TRINITY_DN1509_c0_g1_i1:27-1457(-)